METEEPISIWVKTFVTVFIAALILGLAYYIKTISSVGIGIAVIACLWSLPLTTILYGHSKGSIQICYFNIVGFLIAAVVILYETQVSFNQAGHGMAQYRSILLFVPLLLLYYIYKEFKKIKELKLGQQNTANDVASLNDSKNDENKTL